MILSKEPKSIQSTLGLVTIACYNSGCEMHLQKGVKYKKYESVITHIRKQFKNESWEEMPYFEMEIKSESEQIEEYPEDVLGLEYKGIRYYLLAGTDHGNEYPKLIYDFSFALLKSNPELVISPIDDCYYDLQDMERLEKEIGYHDGWYCRKLPWQT